MPKSTHQRRGEIVASLRSVPCVISPAILEETLANHGVESPDVVASYISRLEKGALLRVPGGWALSPAARETHTIVVRIAPASQAGDVRRALTAALKPFRNVVAMEEAV